MRKSFNPALLSLLAAIIAAVLFFAGQANSYVPVAGATNASGPSVSSYNSPNANWPEPIRLTNYGGQDIGPVVAGSPLNGAAQVMWGRVSGDDGIIMSNNNHFLGEPFVEGQNIEQDGVNLIDSIAIAHDSTGRRHAVTWRWPNGQNLCDYYKQFDTTGTMVLNVVIPGTCDGIPRKLGGIAVDAALNVHIVLGRENTAGSMLYWQRSNAGVWTVQGEALPSGCGIADISMTATAQGTVMAAWKNCGITSGSDIFTAVRVGPNNWQYEDISPSCCDPCPNTSFAYLPKLAPDPSGGIRAVWADGRCVANGPTDIFYREWTPGAGWNGHPIVQVVANSGISYFPAITVDASGEAHLAWGDDTSSPFAYYRIFYAHGHGTVFTAPDIPFQQWFPVSWQRDPSLDFAFNAVHLAFVGVRDDPEKNPYYDYLVVTPPATPTPAPPPCPSAHFTDICPGSTFYTNITNLANAGIINGYTASPPCPNGLWIPCFLQNNTATRGQVSKIVTLGAALPISTTGGPHFEDVPAGSTFYNYIETMFNAGIIGGYACGGPSEPCVPPANRPYFRPNNNVTRGQLSKMATLAFGFDETVSGQTFQDVSPSSTFYAYIQRLNSRGIINGYPCGGPGEPCNPPGNRPYFRPNNNITRGQLSKIVDLCRAQIPPTPTITPTLTATVTETPTEVPTQVPTATQTPEGTPTDTPTAGPSATPTEGPTEGPTETPTEAPTETPTEAPTETPTEIPTDTPTPIPTDTPMVRR
jgi:hypothetical protein